MNPISLPYPPRPPNGQPLFRFTLEVYLVLMNRLGVKQMVLYDTRGSI